MAIQVCGWQKGFKGEDGPTCVVDHPDRVQWSTAVSGRGQRFQTCYLASHTDFPQEKGSSSTLDEIRLLVLPPTSYPFETSPAGSQASGNTGPAFCSETLLPQLKAAAFSLGGNQHLEENG